jgi:hypothetical protein
LVRAGEEIEVDNLTFRILEVEPYFSASKKRSVMIAYVLKDGNFQTPKAHFWMPISMDIRDKLKELAEYYNKMKVELRKGIPP